MTRFFGKESNVRSKAYALLSTALIYPCIARADELDDFKKRAQNYYDTMIPAYTEIGRKSHVIAENLIDYSIYGSQNEVNAAFEYSFEQIFYSYKKLESCFKSHDAVASIFVDALKKEPVDAKARFEYWKSNYGYDQLDSFSAAMNSMQNIQSQCLGDLQKIRRFISVMKSHQREKFKICETVKKNLPYERLRTLLPPDRTPLGRLSHTWYSTLPLVKVTGSVLGGGCPVSVVTASCYSSKYFTWEAVRNQYQADQSYENFRSHYPELAAATYLSFLSYMNGFELGTGSQNPGGDKPSSVPGSGSLSNTGGANLIANLVWLGLLYGEAEEYKKRVDKINKWVKAKEAELDAVVASSYISEEEFESKKSNSCATAAGDYDQALVELLNFFDTPGQEEKLDSYLAQVDKIQNWYGALFLYFVENGLVDELAKNKLLSLRDQHYAALNASKVKADFAITQQSIDGIQQEIARTRCSSDSDPSVTSRGLKKLVNRFQLFCDNALQVYGSRTDKIQLGSSTDSDKKARCYYQGFDEAVKSIRIKRDGSGFTSTIEAIGTAGDILFTVDHVSSLTQDSVTRLQPQFYCSAIGSGTFGTEAGDILSPGEYSMSPDIGLGSPLSDISGMKIKIKDKAALIRSKVSRCNSVLPDFRRVPLPDLNSCQQSGGL